MPLLELKALVWGFAHFAEVLAGRRVVLVTDCQPCMYWVRAGGSADPYVSDLVHQLWEIALANSIDLLECEWEPREANKVADALTRLDPRDKFEDWGLSVRCLRWLEARFTTRVTVDRFATLRSSLCDRFNSREWTPLADARDAFAQDWSRDVNLAVPSFDLLPELLSFLFDAPARVLLILPGTESQTCDKWQSVRENPHRATS